MRKWFNTRVVIGLLLLLGFLIAGIFPKLFTHFSPYYKDQFHMPLFDTPPFPPSKLHPLGTNNEGRDTLSRILYGILPTLRDATILVCVTIPLSFAIAMVTTLYRPKLIRFVLDTVGNALQVVPPIVIAILVLELPDALFTPHGTYWYYGVIIVLESARFVKVMEGDMELVYGKPFIEGAVIAGNSSFGLFRRHMLRWLWPYIAEYIPLQYARILTIMGELGYFGLYNNVHATMTDSGPAISTTQLSWPATIAEGSHYWFGTPCLIFFATLAFCLLILAFRLFAAGVSLASEIEKPHYWPWPERLHNGKTKLQRHVRKQPATTSSVHASR